jgi:hypothetical protein
MLNIITILTKFKNYAIIVGLALIFIFSLLGIIKNLTQEIEDKVNELKLDNSVTRQYITKHGNYSVTTVASFNSTKIIKQEIKDLGLTKLLADANISSLKKIKQLEFQINELKLKTDSIKGKEKLTKPNYKEFNFDTTYKYFSINATTFIKLDSNKTIKSVNLKIDSLVLTPDSNVIITEVIPKKFLFIKYGVREIVCKSYHTNKLFNTSSLKVINKK